MTFYIRFIQEYDLLQKSKWIWIFRPNSTLNTYLLTSLDQIYAKYYRAIVSHYIVVLLYILIPKNGQRIAITYLFYPPFLYLSFTFFLKFILSVYWIRCFLYLWWSIIHRRQWSIFQRANPPPLPPECFTGAVLGLHPVWMMRIQVVIKYLTTNQVYAL